jgi:hypothetical protein
MKYPRQITLKRKEVYLANNFAGLRAWYVYWLSNNKDTYQLYHIMVNSNGGTVWE